MLLSMCEYGQAFSAIDWVKWIGAAVTLGGFLWGIVVTLRTQSLTARKPFLDYQLKLYQEITQVAGILATSEDDAERKTFEKRFWQMYWAELALVENGGYKPKDGGVEAAMVHFGTILRHRSSKKSLHHAALMLAHACRDSLAESWHVSDWAEPDYTPPRGADQTGESD
jgi:hypothetical protein